MARAGEYTLNEKYLNACVEKLSSARMRKKDLEKFEEMKRAILCSDFYEDRKKLSEEC